MSWQNEAIRFLAHFLEQVEKLKFDVATLELDHICFRTDSAEDYDTTKHLFAGCAKLLVESPIAGRPIATYLLREPLTFAGRSISVVEVPAPKTGKPYARGFEHGEFVLQESFESFARRHPHVTFHGNLQATGLNPEISADLEPFEGRPTQVKFHPRTLQEVIRIEVSNSL